MIPNMVNNNKASTNVPFLVSSNTILPFIAKSLKGIINEDLFVSSTTPWGHSNGTWLSRHMHTHKPLTITVIPKLVCAGQHKLYFSIHVQVRIMNLQGEHILTCHILGIPHTSVWNINKLGNVVVDVSQADSDL